MSNYIITVPTGNLTPVQQEKFRKEILKSFKELFPEDNFLVMSNDIKIYQKLNDKLVICNE